MLSARFHPGLLIVAALAALTACLIIFQNTGRSPAPKITVSQTQPNSTHAAKIVTGVPRVIDGDTLAIHGVRIRLNGIDAPESKQSCQMDGREYPCGERATEELISFLAGRTTACAEVARDRYRRIVASCAVDSTDVGGWMVEHGWAIAYRKYSTEYVPAEQRAQSEREGMWAGTFTQPEEWRRAKAMEKSHVQR